MRERGRPWHASRPVERPEVRLVGLVVAEDRDEREPGHEADVEQPAPEGQLLGRTGTARHPLGQGTDQPDHVAQAPTFHQLIVRPAGTHRVLLGSDSGRGGLLLEDDGPRACS